MEYNGRNFQDYDWLYNKYINCNMSSYDIAKEENVSQTVVFKWLKIYNIPRRLPSDYLIGVPRTDEIKQKISNGLIGRKHTRETKQKLSLLKRGENNPNWAGGITGQKYCYKFNNLVKENVRDKFDRTCFICGKSENECNTKLSVHHIDYNKNTLCNGKTWGLIPLCASCHAKTNFNRWYWFNLLGNYWAIRWVIYYV